MSDNENSGMLSRIRARQQRQGAASSPPPTLPESMQPSPPPQAYAPPAPASHTPPPPPPPSGGNPPPPAQAPAPAPVMSAPKPPAAPRVPSAPPPPTNDGSRPGSSVSLLDIARKHIQPIVEKRISIEEARAASRGILARRITVILNEWLSATGQELNLIDQRNVVTYLINSMMEKVQQKYGSTGAPSAPSGGGGSANVPALPGSPKNQMEGDVYRVSQSSTNKDSAVMGAKVRVQSILMNRIDTVAAASLPKEELAAQLNAVVGEILVEQKLQLNKKEKDDLITLLLNDMLGLGPLEPLVNDESITDIMVNGPNQTYVEKSGKLVLTDVKFRDNQHLLNICGRIVSAVGRRVDESSPMVDARLQDGSRVNIIIPPLALDGPSISIRKFSNKGITLPMMVAQGNLSAEMATVLQIAARSRVNVIISGGTGSGKTTLLNALSQMIENSERIVTCEDSAELQLQQPHVVRLETRPANLEGDGEITIRDLVKNALRMRPERIIVGECRGGEIIDMLQAMNTGHDGSMSTIHANNPRTCLTRMENMLNMAGFNMPEKVVRSMVSSAVDLIVQVQRMRDGKRRVTHIMEVVGMEESVVVCQDLFWYEYKAESEDGAIVGNYVCSGLRPHLLKKAEYYGLGKPLLAAIA